MSTKQIPQMHRNVMVILTLLFMGGCIAPMHIAEVVGLQESDLASIPENAVSIMIIADNTEPEVLFEKLVTGLINRQHRIAVENKERNYITTEGKDIGQSTTQRMTISVQKQGTTAIGSIASEWKGGADVANAASVITGINYNTDWYKAVWAVDRSGIAFAECVALAKSIEGVHIQYKVE